MVVCTVVTVKERQTQISILTSRLLTAYPELDYLCMYVNLEYADWLYVLRVLQ